MQQYPLYCCFGICRTLDQCLTLEWQPSGETPVPSPTDFVLNFPSLYFFCISSTISPLMPSTIFPSPPKVWEPCWEKYKVVSNSLRKPLPQLTMLSLPSLLMRVLRSRFISSLILLKDPPWSMMNILTFLLKPSHNLCVNLQVYFKIYGVLQSFFGNFPVSQFTRLSSMSSTNLWSLWYSLSISMPMLSHSNFLRILLLCKLWNVVDSNPHHQNHHLPLFSRHAKTFEIVAWNTTVKKSVENSRGWMICFLCISWRYF